ncbi:hypothetical protein CXG81DRAFT_18749 [Caulochytrium protostelioides]|uniref:Uncharacterized protein n=1 Tax=Caulochytrium protostelioides TaxID=1555241 RepID=A0A4P9X831_9FUNG|nr:hypothetical protein CXG81DRAFT_18749 [Caulochytrium protostelioides]|eukprot:RKP01427.1 hypothetical protein CXG81DRAFT_18749 [Caulochytrium protostelioides]
MAPLLPARSPLTGSHDPFLSLAHAHQASAILGGFASGVLALDCRDDSADTDARDADDRDATRNHDGPGVGDGEGDDLLDRWWPTGHARLQGCVADADLSPSLALPLALPLPLRLGRPLMTSLAAGWPAPPPAEDRLNQREAGPHAPADRRTASGPGLEPFPSPARQPFDSDEAEAMAWMAALAPAHAAYDPCGPTVAAAGGPAHGRPAAAGGVPTGSFVASASLPPALPPSLMAPSEAAHPAAWDAWARPWDAWMDLSSAGLGCGGEGAAKPQGEAACSGHHGGMPTPTPSIRNDAEEAHDADGAAAAPARETDGETIGVAAATGVPLSPQHVWLAAELRQRLRDPRDPSAAFGDVMAQLMQMRLHDAAHVTALLMAGWATEAFI